MHRHSVTRKPEMSALLQKYVPFIIVVTSGDNKQTRAILSTVTDNQIRVLSEIAANTLHANIPLSAKSLKLLKKHKKLIKSLASTTLALKTKKRLIVKHWKGLLVLLNIVRPFVETLK